jgi:muconolactone delta-isomerase
MEFLVTMTTHVPDGTTPAEVDDMRAREAANTEVLAAQGRVLRLWRPPLGPGEWRSIGLFDADGPTELEAVLATMPLRVWRTDEVIPLGPFGNDPGRGAVPVAPAKTEYLVWFSLDLPAGRADDLRAAEAARTRELAAGGTLLRLWTTPGRGVGLWQAENDERMREILAALPVAEWFTSETVPLTRHPSDPLRLD